MPPGPTDVRGGCPGLNLLANYGYIPRSGITDMTTLLYAMQEALAIKTCVDLTTLKMSIGDTDARTDGPLTFLLGRTPGLFAPQTHNKYEVDGSLTTDDAYFAGGQTKQFDGSRWATWYKLAETKYNGIMTAAWNGEVRSMQYDMCRNSNPECHWGVIEQLVFYLGQAFIPTMMTSTGADGLPGPALVDSINQFMGIVKQPDGTFTRGHSHLPPGPEGVWYRRTIPLTTVELAVPGALSLLSHLPQFGHNEGRVGKWNVAPIQIPDVIAAPTVACLLLKSALDTNGTRFEGATLPPLKNLLEYVLAPVKNQLSCN
ncbi:uncharacterized protein MELLADRAFT_112693 [Melampsora larici-populina 98AG31]|uniref:Heme haloperoxidase family profile domain-containing protein n=1 Tax=Melampsora larici-populina (strain 98AG31 / pathotype 3-4-7) TaxID=747676 RepID=F4S7A4_MELLP|nr:uncharacterized protein MELLADRAFT_112693 [Melampsora larici-populina 98AG31]EGF99482.1 hypothetical protein MELLADRAFT_112693 [Melampsora larici-populina 98AG31]